MATISPTRPSRRAATRRKVVVESDDDDASGGRPATPEQRQPDEDSEDDFTPAAAAKKSPRRQSRRKTTNAMPATPRTAARSRRTRTGESIEPSEVFDPDESTAPPEPVSPTKKASPRKRKSAAAAKSRASVAPELPPPLPTPAASASPEPSQLHGTPLADITDATLNEGPTMVVKSEPAPDTSVMAKVPPPPPDAAMARPMDIVIKSRATALPVPEEPSAPKSRIVIKYLVLTNFKSYAGRQEVGPFHTSFSSVVGPNGSGKSNVIDSLLFVFGFRASKMRQGKISALIHNSANFPNIDHCEVEVHFQEVMDLPGGAHEVVPDSTMIISRKAFRNNSSKYYINARESNFTTVTTLLRERGVDLDHKRFLILQGEVESIAQMKPKAANEHDDGLLEYLEDIIGTSKYKAPIEESAAEVETLNEVCVEKSSRVQHVEKERNGLEDKKNKALAFIRDENELAVKQSALYQLYIDECGDNARVTEEAVAQMQAQLQEEMERHQGNEQGMKALEKTFKKGQREYEALEKETQGVVKDMAKFDKENVKIEEKRKFLTGKQKKLEKTLQTSWLAVSEAISQIGHTTDDAERNAAQVAALEESMRAEEKELGAIRDALKGKTQEFSDEIAAKQKSLEPWNAKVNEKQSAIAVAQSELDILVEKGNAGAVALEEVNTRIAGIEEARTGKTAELEQLKAQRASVGKQVSKVQAELDKLAEKEPAMRAQISGARQKADEARASLSNTQTQGNVLAGLMRLKESGRIERSLPWPAGQLGDHRRAVRRSHLNGMPVARQFGRGLGRGRTAVHRLPAQEQPGPSHGHAAGPAAAARSVGRANARRRPAAV